MAVWAIIIIAVLFLVIVGVGVFFALITKNNYDLSAQQILYPFAGVIDPTQPNTIVPLTYTDAATGETGNQITCPAGTTVNIVGAFFDIVDPYGTCTSNPNGLISATCGGPGTATCSPGQACPEGMVCEQSQSPTDTQSYCVAMPCKAGDTLPANTTTTTWTCNPSPALPLTDAQKAQGYTGRVTPVEICNNLTYNSSINNFQNATCANGANGCAPRDASAYLAKACNGQQTCAATITPDFFGPYPCGSSTFTNPSTTGSGGITGCSPPTTQVTSGYCSLPYTPGTDPSFTPTNGSAAAPTSFSQGYMVHGIYTCIPK